ncbi:MAG: N-carbamoylputrescine amidase, partial [Gammaproteobacteria bacterium]|nr:N-carbamoylputrescine amidase [Gammaproteobacteria bacterium]
MTTLTVAATQMACGRDLPANLERADKLIRESAERGAQVILIQELFEAPYFCIEQDARHFELATSVDENPAIKR